MQDLGGKPVIVRTYEAAVQTGLFDEVYVVTDSEIIFNAISEFHDLVLVGYSCVSDIAFYFFFSFLYPLFIRPLCYLAL